MTKKIFLSFRLLLTVGLAITVFNSCTKEPLKRCVVRSLKIESEPYILKFGEECTLSATVEMYPEDCDPVLVEWKSNKPDIVDVDKNTGTIIIKNTGEVEITAKAGGEEAACFIKIVAKKFLLERDFGGLVINGIRWATRNVDAPGFFADSFESAGMLYQWNRKKPWLATGSSVKGWDSSLPAGTTWDSFNDPSPAGWRVPTLKEIQELLDSTVSRDTVIKGVNGKIYKKTGDRDSLFLPAAGYRDVTGTLRGKGELGRYWSRSRRMGDALVFSVEKKDTTFDYFSSQGFSIRAVRKIE